MPPSYASPFFLLSIYEVWQCQDTILLKEVLKFIIIFQLQFISIFQLTFTAHLPTKPKVCSNLAGDETWNKESGKMGQKSHYSCWP